MNRRYVLNEDMNTNTLTAVISRWSHYEELSLSKSFMSVLSEYLIKGVYYLYNCVVKQQLWRQRDLESNLSSTNN